MSTLYKCDMCGAIRGYKLPCSVSIRKNGTMDTSIDLCHECADKLKDLVSNEQNAKGEIPMNAFIKDELVS